jgi:acetyltransferase-like isoleucine patch superfamily enzyme
MRLKFILLFCKAPFVERIFLFFLKKNQMDSELLREYYKRSKGIIIGKFSYGCFTNDIPAGTIIGNYCSFAAGVKIFNGNHGIEWATTHPFLYNVALGMVETETIIRHQLQVGHDVWIGADSIILPSVKKIGNGAVVGAGSVVTKDIEPYSIVAGNPAKHIRYRFEQKYIDVLESIQIYNFSKQEFISNIKRMYNKSDFHEINNYKK